MPMFLLGGDEYLKAFTASQLRALSHLSVKAYRYGFGMGLIFFGWNCLLVGYLIFRSGFLPWLIGILMGIVGLGYPVNRFILILAPAYAPITFPILPAHAFPAELSPCVRLLVKGVNMKKWTLGVNST